MHILRNERALLIGLTVSIVLMIAPEAAASAACPATVFFGNGIHTTQDDARATASVLRDAVNQSLNATGRQPLAAECFQVAYATNSSVPYLGDLIESTEQLVLGDYSRFWSWLGGGANDAPTTFEQAMQDAFKAVSDIQYATSPDLQEQVRNYRAVLDSEDTTVVVVAHSQGNLFANDAFAALVTGADGFAPIRPETFRIVAVATPQGVVATGDDWTTLYGDAILAVPGSAPANTDVDGTPCHSIIPQLPGLHALACHLFDSSYLRGVFSRPRILNQVVRSIPLPDVGLPQSALYVIASDTIFVVQNGRVIRSWRVHGFDEGAIAVSGTVRTLGDWSGTLPGSEYTLSGQFTGTTYSYPLLDPRTNLYDGTTDGVHNYSVEYSNAIVYQFDRNWGSPVPLFQLFQTIGNQQYVAMFRYMGIAYDSLSGSVWLARDKGDLSGGIIENRSLTGDLLSTFDVPYTGVSGLALDSADRTLWFGASWGPYSHPGTLFQYSRAGLYLSSLSLPELAGATITGGEFQVGSAR